MTAASAIRKYFRDLADDLKKLWSSADEYLTMREVINASEFENELRMVAATEEQREDIRRAAIELAKLGLTFDQVVAAAIRAAKER